MNIRQKIQRTGSEQKYNTKVVRIPVEVESLVMAIADYYRLNPNTETLNKLTQLLQDIQDHAI